MGVGYYITIIERNKGSGNRQDQEYIIRDTNNYCVVLQSTEQRAKSRPLNTRCSLFTGSPSGE
jgi:hypothetical protein